MYYESCNATICDKDRISLPAKITREGSKKSGDYVYFHDCPKKECVVVFLEDNDDFELERVKLLSGNPSPRFIIPKDFKNSKPFSSGKKLTIHFFPKEGFFRIYSRKSKGS